MGWDDPLRRAAARREAERIAYENGYLDGWHAHRRGTMMLYYPGATQRPGPPAKVWQDINAVAGVICHSMQGSLAGAYTVLDDETLVDDTYFRAASWHFSILKDGTVLQHYPLTACPFHAGNHANNDRLIGVEHEGGPPGNLSEPLTEAQTVSSVALVRWIAQQGAWGPLQRHVNLFEHNEVTSTICPSGRIPWAQYEEEQVETTPVVNADFTVFLSKLGQGGVTVGKIVGKPGEYLVTIPGEA